MKELDYCELDYDIQREGSKCQSICADYVI